MSATPAAVSAHFPDHTPQTAPEAARPMMAGITKHFGYLPSAVARMATSPQALEGFQRANAAFGATSLDPLSREVVVLTVATRNECHLCVAMHTAVLTGLDADPVLIAALREQRPLPDARLEALRVFAVELVESRGAVDPQVMDAFLAHGYTPQNALEVVLGVGVYTISTLANRLTGAPVDEAMAQFA
ncbi:carboxymuconolactone decarboxylase family protein [Kitasatospora viridis]|uniref:AhpD family alkylhydroperoxidase n=1 Tax=Kitasatospora viridis TaxID=281105 RepID=A0A561UH43_9ACTN|nr:carboxymuconolactone decarboxylase family protein [Kitasatospora viridis]TWF98674.1 AhpD family alkylhydroperoxidase [Kitasatospora viridis]